MKSSVIHRKTFRPLSRQNLAARKVEIRISEPTVEVRPSPVEKPVIHHTEKDSTLQIADGAKAAQQFTRDCEVLRFCSKHHLSLAHNEYWYMVINPRVGEIAGLPTLRGTPRITNGIIAWFEKPDGTVFEAHIASFVGDKKPRTQGEVKKSYLVNLLARL